MPHAGSSLTQVVVLLTPGPLNRCWRGHVRDDGQRSEQQPLIQGCSHSHNFMCKQRLLSDGQGALDWSSAHRTAGRLASTQVAGHSFSGPEHDLFESGSGCQPFLIPGPLAFGQAVASVAAASPPQPLAGPSAGRSFEVER